MFITRQIASGWSRRFRGWLIGITLIGALAPLPRSAASAAETANLPADLIPAALQPSVPTLAPSGAEGPIAARLAAAGAEISGERLHSALLRQFYSAHAYQPVWATHAPQATSLLSAVLRAADHGLDPELFHAALLQKSAILPPIDHDILLSDAFLGFADALARGALPIERRMDDEDLTPPPLDVAAVLGRAIETPDPAAIIEALAPHSPDYLALQRALQAFRQEAVGGRAGVGVTARIREIEVNLERLRWLPRDFPPNRVWVNTATTELVLYREGRPAFTGRVVAGQVDKQTPELATTINSVLFNPPWNVPPSIAHSEILPKLAEDPGYLARHHMVWRSNGGIQQLAGPHSALGRLKFEMEDRFDVYLHDTPEKYLFARADRRRSHGCVRVQNAVEMAALLLGVSPETITKEIAVGYTHRQMLPVPVPVFVVYQTAFLDLDGQVKIVPDVYHRDQEIWPHLHSAQQAPVAEHDPMDQRHG